MWEKKLVRSVSPGKNETKLYSGIVVVFRVEVVRCNDIAVVFLRPGSRPLDDFLGVEPVFPFPIEESVLLGELITC